MLSVLATDHRKSCLPCLFGPQIIGKPVRPFSYCGESSSEILSVMSVLATDHGKSNVFYLFW